MQVTLLSNWARLISSTEIFWTINMPCPVWKWSYYQAEYNYEYHRGNMPITVDMLNMSNI